jgi:hypothetical protein
MFVFQMLWEDYEISRFRRVASGRRAEFSALDRCSDRLRGGQVAASGGIANNCGTIVGPTFESAFQNHGVI